MVQKTNFLSLLFFRMSVKHPLCLIIDALLYSDSI